MTTAYKNTDVPIHKSREGIEKLLMRVGARGFRWESDLQASREAIAAILNWEGRTVGFRLGVQYEKGDERNRRQVMRALYWYLKSKIEAIEFGLFDLEEEFLPYLLTASGRTVSEELEKDPRFEIKALPDPDGTR